MSQIYLFVLSAIVVLILGHVAIKPARIFEYPYFMAATFAVFVLPQGYSLVRFPGSLGPDEVADILLMSILCLVSAVLGYSVRPTRVAKRMFDQPLDLERLYLTGVGLICVGFISSYLLAADEEIQAVGNQGTGRITLYFFFGSLALPGFCICVRLLWERFTTGRLLWVMIGALLPLSAILFSGRRETAVSFGMAIVLTRFFQNRKSPARALIFGSIFFAMVAIPAIGTYRGLMATGRGDLVKEIRLVDNFKDFFNKESILELRNGAAVMHATNFTGNFGWGRGYWNQLVFRFVPAQIVGRDIKDSLMIGTDSRRILEAQLENKFEISSGSTITGMGDSYREFGWLGCLFFAIVGRFFRALWNSCVNHDAIFPQIFYIMICTSAMRALTHQSVDFLPGMIHQFIFLGMGYAYAKIPIRDVRLRTQMRAPAARRR